MKPGNYKDDCEIKLKGYFYKDLQYLVKANKDILSEENDYKKSHNYKKSIDD